MRIVGSSDAGRFEGPGHFFSAAATAMRRVLIDQARRRRRIVRGGDRNRIELDPDLIPSVQEADEVLALDAALCKFAEIDPVKARLVELRYFAGLTLEEAGRILGISARTADRHWAYARAWLHREIRGETPERTNSADPS